ncbi:MAG: cupin domain-containing protein [Steroidobacteraceae bacterium]
MYPDFVPQAVTAAAGGARIHEKLLVGPAEFGGLGDIGCARFDKGLQLVHGPHAVWVLFVVLKGRIQLQSPAQECRVYDAGSSFFLEPGTSHTETALDDGTVVLAVTGHSDDSNALADYHLNTVSVE